jgi:hypothetical protein
MKDFFRTANRLFPIYLESSFMKMVEWQYTQQTCDDAARWASINMVICLAYEYRSSNSHKSEKDKERAELYFKNAMSVFTELALKRTDLLSIQALISMVSPFFFWLVLIFNKIERLSSSVGTLAPSQLYHSSLQLCGRANEWGFIGTLQGRTSAQMNRKRGGVSFGLLLSSIKGKSNVPV